jgi:hypothetical protein
MHDMQDEKTISVGAWIRIKPLWPGIWRVSRVLSGFNESQWRLDATPTQSHQVLLFCDRIVNNDWKRSFRTQCCESSYATLLDSEDANKLESQLDADSKLREAFAKYQATSHPIDLIANVALGGMDEEIVTQFLSDCDEMLSHRIEAGLTVNGVLQSLDQRDLLKYLSKNPKRVTLQLTCVDHEVRSNEFVFRKYRTRNG